MNIERVEFIRGPGAAVYGSNAMMGVINIITRVGANEVSVSYGQFNRQQIHILSSHQIDEISFDIFAHLDKDQGENYWLPDTFSSEQIQTDDPKKVTDLNVKVAWQNTHINFQHKKDSADNFYQFATLSNNFNMNTTEINTLSLKQDFNWLSIFSCFWLSYNQTDTELSTQLTAPGELFIASGGASNDALFTHGNFYNNNETRLQWHNNWSINKQNSLQFGIEFRYLDSPQNIIENNFDIGDIANGNFPIAYYGDLLPTTQVQNKSSRNIVGYFALPILISMKNRCSRIEKLINLPP